MTYVNVINFRRCYQKIRLLSLSDYWTLKFNVEFIFKMQWLGWRLRSICVTNDHGYVPFVITTLCSRYSIFSFMCIFCISLFVLFLLTFVLSVLNRRRTDNTKVNRRRTDNTKVNRRRTDNTMVNRRRTDNTKVNRKRTNNDIQKIHIKLKIE
jgi:hypothetical protein